MKSMINYIKDIFSRWTIKFLKGRGYTVISKKEYDYLNSEKNEYLKVEPVAKVQVEPETANDDLINRVKELITKLENNDFTNNLITSEVNEENQTEGVKHMKRLMELIETKTYKVGALEDVTRERMKKDIDKYKQGMPEEIKTMQDDFINHLIKEKKESEDNPPKDLDV